MGNDLSRRVALKMGWEHKPWWCCAAKGWGPCPTQDEHDCMWLGFDNPIEECPHRKDIARPPDYAHDLNLAWNLVPPYGMINLERYKQGPFAHVSFDGKSGMAFHENPASAICLAWLEAMEGKP